LVVILSRGQAAQGIYPAVDPLHSGSRLLDRHVVGDHHYAIAEGGREHLARYRELDRRLRQLFIDQLKTLPESALKHLRRDRHDAAPRIEVVSGLPLDEAQQQAIRQVLEQRIGASQGQWQFRQDTQLIAGLRISIGGGLLHANLQHELRFLSIEEIEVILLGAESVCVPGIDSNGTVRKENR
jgi:hypothetical protein